MNRTIYTIGHSNHTVEKFIGLLKNHSIDVVADVRSNPYSRYASQFNKKAIQRYIQNNGMKYLFTGKESGGKPSNSQYYDSDGFVLYSRIAESPLFKEGITRLMKGIKQSRVALMCSEENPATCHRSLLIGKVLIDHGIDVLHIRGDGRIQSEKDILKENNMLQKNEVQQNLFDLKKSEEWKSIRPFLK